MNITVLAIDLAKHVFQLHGLDADGRTVLRKRIQRQALASFVAQLPPCVVAMEACGSSNHWARVFREQGHQPKLIQARFVKPFLKTNKNDAADAEAIAEAASRPGMRFVRLKEVWQQEIQHLHRIRSHQVKERTALGNEIRGILQEYGITLPQGWKALREKLALLREESAIPSPRLQMVVGRLWDRLLQIDSDVKELEREIGKIARERDDCRRIQALSGVGPLTATTVIATIGDPASYRNGRAFAASIGLVPRQASSGGRQVLLGISKRGDRYLRYLMIQGARAAIQSGRFESPRLETWVRQKVATRGVHRAAVALANKNARVIWALLRRREEYQPAAA